MTMTYITFTIMRAMITKLLEKKDNDSDLYDRYQYLAAPGRGGTGVEHEQVRIINLSQTQNKNTSGIRSSVAGK